MNLFTILPVNTNDNSLPRLNPDDVQLFGSAEYGATGHWLFGGGASSLTGITASKSTLLEGSTSPVFSSNYVTLNGYPAGLTSPSADAVDATDTLCFVFKTPTSISSDIICGNATLTSGDGGFFVATNASKELYVTYRTSSTANLIGSGLVENTWYFVAISRDFSGSTRKITTKLSELSTALTTLSGSYTASSTNIAIGNATYNNAARPVDFAEFITFDTAYTSGGLEAVYARSKERMESRGIILP